MMRFLILTVGKTKAPFFREAIAHYLEAIGHMAEIEYVETREGSNDPEREAGGMLATLEKRGLLGSGKAKLVLLDVGGKAFDSETWAATLGRWRDNGAQTVVFLVGGAFGFAASLRRALPAAERLSLSPLTFPHELARVVLCEQLYRALHIQSGSKYHHS